MPRQTTAVLLLAACLATTCLATRAGATDLLAHRAVYDLKLQASKDDAVTAASGRMDYEMLDVCDGWATHQRLAMQVTNNDGQTIQMLSDYTTFESKNGRQMSFHMKQTTDEAVTSEVEGDATLAANGSGGRATFTIPQQSQQTLPPGTLFPTAHTATLLAAAESGKKMLGVPLFDGTTDKGAEDSFILVNTWSAAKPFRFPLLARLPSGRFHISFFDRAPSAMEPDYEVSLRYWANGVADDLSMDFGDFVMGGTLRQFTPMPPHGC
jgi:hypothetical protein